MAKDAIYLGLDVLNVGVLNVGVLNIGVLKVLVRVHKGVTPVIVSFGAVIFIIETVSLFKLGHNDPN